MDCNLELCGCKIACHMQARVIGQNGPRLRTQYKLEDEAQGYRLEASCHGLGGLTDFDAYVWRRRR